MNFFHNGIPPEVCAGLEGIVPFHFFRSLADTGVLGSELQKAVQCLNDLTLPKVTRKLLFDRLVKEARNRFPTLIKPQVNTRIFEKFLIPKYNPATKCIIIRDPTMFVFAVKIYGPHNVCFITDDAEIYKWYSNQGAHPGRKPWVRADDISNIGQVPRDAYRDENLTEWKAAIEGAAGILQGYDDKKSLADFICAPDGRCVPNSEPPLIVAGNPPYQREVGRSSAQPIYPVFVDHALSLGAEVFFLVPGRWYAGGKNLDQFRESMLLGGKAQTVVDFPNSSTIFDQVDIEGGVCLLHAKNTVAERLCFITYDGREHRVDTRVYDILVRDPDAHSIIDKAVAGSEKFMNALVYPQTPFGLYTSFDNYVQQNEAGAIPCRTKDGIKWVPAACVTKNLNLIPKYKVIASEAFGKGDHPDKFGRRKVMGTVEILPPGHVCLQTYLVIAVFETEAEAINCVEYYKLKFPRFLLAQRKNTQHISANTFKWVPHLDFSQMYTDEMLYKKFALTDEEINLIEKRIKSIGDVRNGQTV